METQDNLNPSIPDLSRPYHLLVVGPSGCGKTTLIRKLSQSQPRLLILDPQGEYDGSAFWDLPSYVERLQRGGSGRFIYRPRSITDRDEPQAFGECILPFAARNGGCLAVVEELSAIYAGGGNCSGIEQVYLRGRHYQARTISASQTLNRLPSPLLSCFSGIVMFRLHNPRDVERAENWIPSASSRFAEMGRHDYMIYKPGDPPEAVKINRASPLQ